MYPGYPCIENNGRNFSGGSTFKGSVLSEMMWSALAIAKYYEEEYERSAA